MPKRSATPREQDLATAHQAPPAPVQEPPAPAGAARRPAAKAGPRPTPDAPVTGVVGDTSATEVRSGEDTRRRGWFWHWNSIVTQYAPLIGLKGVGLINSYTVWTDRRESSPHRGYAFPSQQREADFYGEDRAELITINKILVALDLIEIRKEMVLRTDEKGRRWKVPHNFYRVKDHGDGFTLTARDVLTIAELAERDRAVYRYLRRVFSPRFAPIDGQNVWHDILVEVRATEVWQRLAARAAKEESKASARSRAGHAARRGNEDEAVFSVPTRSDSEESEATATDSDNDSATGDTNDSAGDQETSVATTNTGSATTDALINSGLNEDRPTSVAPANTAPATSAGPTNTTYHQVKSTTTTRDEAVDNLAGEPDPAPSFGDPDRAPDDLRATDITIRHFEEANARPSTPAERRLLRQLAERFDATAREAGSSGWVWLAQAIDDAVSAGSAFVAPRRVREILTRWERDGVPVEYRPAGGDRDESSRDPYRPVTGPAGRSHRPGEVGRAPVRESIPVPDPAERAWVPPVVAIDACGMTSRQVWSAVLADLEAGSAIGRTDVATWLRDAAVLGEREGTALVIGVPHDLARRRAAGRYLAAIRAAVHRVTGVSYAIEIVLFRDWAAA